MNSSPENDLDAAFAFCDYLGGTAGVDESGSFLLWNGGYWSPDDSARSLTRSYVDWLLGTPIPPTRCASSRWLESSRSQPSILRVVHLTKKFLPSVPSLDTEGCPIFIGESVIEVRTGAVKPSSPDRGNRSSIAVTYDPDAVCPSWLKFLEEIIPDESVRNFAQKVMGYCLTYETSAQYIFIALGSGANGKSVFLETIKEILGKQAGALPPEALMIGKGEKHRSESAALRGKTMALVPELPRSAKLNASLVKSLTGGDSITERDLYQASFEHKPTAKYWINANHPPDVDIDDYGLVRRIVVVPFDVTIPWEERDPTLRDRLRTESSGILNWLLDGCQRWQKEGLTLPPSIQAATMKAIASGNSARLFIRARIVRSPGEETSAKELKSSYLDWCSRNAANPSGQRTLSSEMKKAGFQNKKNGCIFWCDASLRSAECLTD